MIVDISDLSDFNTDDEDHTSSNTELLEDISIENSLDSIENNRINDISVHHHERFYCVICIETSDEISVNSDRSPAESTDFVRCHGNHYFHKTCIEGYLTYSQQYVNRTVAGCSLSGSYGGR